MGTSSNLRAAQESAGVAAPAPPTFAAARRAALLPLAAAAQHLAQLNLQYIALLATDGGLADTLTSRIRGLSDDARMAMADCPFSLFELGFDDSCRWLPLLNGAAAEVTSLPADAYGVVARGEFVATLVFLAWHLAHSDPLAAKVLLELDTRVAAALRATPVARLRAVADGAANGLKPRWPQNRFFWPPLIRYSSDPAGAGLRAAKLLGRQLLATESLALLSTSNAVVGAGLPVLRSTRQTLAACRATRGSFALSGTS